MSSKQNRDKAVAEGKTRYQGAPCIQGHSGIRLTRNSDCVECRNANKRNAYSKIKANQPEKLKRSKSEWYLAHKEKILENQRAYRQTTNGKALESVKKAVKRISKFQTIPTWANKEAIKQFYIEAITLTINSGVMHHVDHIIPLRGKIVSGLHVSTNLQVITADENQLKRNNYTPE